MQFQSWVSSIDSAFWYELGRLKLNEFKLDQSAVPIHAYYGTGYPGVPTHLFVNLDAFKKDFKAPSYHYKMPGELHNTNTIESFKTLDKKKLSETISKQIWEDIESGKAIKDPSLLNRFAVITYVDLKKYHYYYWFSFPSIQSEEPCISLKNELLSDVLSQSQIQQFKNGLEPIRDKEPFFVLNLTGDSVSVHPFQEIETIKSTAKELIIGFMDPGYQDGILGWPLRNLLPLLRKLGLKIVKILSFKYPPENSKDILSRVFTVEIGDYKSNNGVPVSLASWEKNHKGELKPKFLNLSNTMDHKQLAESAVELNLKLMRWRVLPGLNLERVFASKCLLLGAGTLGCNLARNLLSWGVRTITLVDYGKVSYSNPVRQTLFCFEDSEEGKPKAPTAAQMLKKIFPNINAKGIEMSIPMPGHPIEEKNKKAFFETLDQLDQLISEHDFTFLGLDSREARWLPSLIAASKSKAVINVALGFDSFVVMRHGAPNYTQKPSTPSPTLGCYFCNDIMAPSDSMTDRTLDQQCTVTRPGLSFMASAVATELMVSILHHPKGINAPPEGKIDIGEKASTELGIIPHQIRGFLTNFQNVTLVGQQYTRCVACSEPVVSAYHKNPHEFVYSVCNNPLVLEDITGITKMKQEQDSHPIDWEVADEDFDDL
uniref:Ubiquitin-like modifier-activating enzyme ATG7 n=1 Tax=Arcella intermedia TaxID=1963864 RepID=A0A6B2KZK5_9EUKA